MSTHTSDHLNYELEDYVSDVLQTAYYITFCVVFLAAALFPAQ